MDIGHDTPDKQGDNCLQPASENYQQFLFSLKATFGGFVWKFRLEILFGNLFWKFCLDISVVNFVWNFVWKFQLKISFGSFVWKFCLEILFGRPTDRQTDRATS